MANIHFSSDASHAIYFACMRPGGIDNNRSFNLFSTRQSHSGYLFAVVIDRNNFRLKPGFSAMMFRRKNIIMRRKHRVVHEPTKRIIKTAQLTNRVITKRWIVNFFRRPITSRIKCRKLFAQLLGAEYLIRNTDLVPNFANCFSAVTLGAINEIAGANKFCHTIRVIYAEITRPVLPHRRRFPSH